jgi:hypothetical protein
MKRNISIMACIAIISVAKAQFNDYFENKTLRLDYFHCGTSDTEVYYFDEIREEPFWGGSHINLIDTFFYGGNYVNVYDSETNKLIYSRGYSSIFDEWQTIEEAKQTGKCCNESVIIPFPKKNIRIELLSRNKKGVFEKYFEYSIDLAKTTIKNEQEPLQCFDIVLSGPSEKKLDIVLLSEGFTTSQFEKFHTDCEKFAAALFSESPYTENQTKFNIRAVWSPSIDSGVDLPGKNIWKNTKMNASYYFFGSERYQLTYDFKTVRNIAGHVPYDYIYVLSNSSKYGGGAIYNFYGLSASGNLASSARIYVHEFGHLLLGLADEYVGNVSYNEFYPINVEPWEPNITTLVNFEKKWKNKLPPHIQIPTPASKENNDKLGVYEGGGYCDKGIYRPMMNCIMNTLKAPSFCPVCKISIQQMINFYAY